MSLLVKGMRSGPGIVDVNSAASGLRYVGFSAHRLAEGETLELDASAGRELCAVVLEGIVTVRSGGAVFERIGKRRSVFDDQPPFAVYLPGNAPLSVLAHSAAEVAIGTAPGTGRLAPRLITPETMRRTVRGKELNTRYVTDILPETELAESLLVVEVRTPPGHSSSYPPHKHDRLQPPEETLLEETYYHRLDPPQGFVFQRVYTDARDIDESHAVEDHDLVVVPRGYHPVVVPWGYRSYYLNVMAGPQRAWHFKNDPAHEWIIQKK
jgi:5-deoxy-glucuronate isomerase